MTNSLQVFDFEEQAVRVVLKDGEPWWVAKDVCDVLELNNITEALRNLDEDELTSEILKSGGQGREMRLISESGLYTLIIRSTKPEAKKFRKWVTAEALPSIRKTGRNDKWEAVQNRIDYSVMLDTNKRHSDGTPIRQLKWQSSIIDILREYLNDDVA